MGYVTYVSLEGYISCPLTNDWPVQYDVSLDDSRVDSQFLRFDLLHSTWGPPVFSGLGRL
jgi:hypothetical protein